MKTNFEYLGIVNDFMRKYNGADISWKESEFQTQNIPIYIETTDQLCIRILCTNDLSAAIRIGQILLNNIGTQMVIRVIKDDGSSFLRISAVRVAAIV